MGAIQFPELLALSVAERIQLAQDLWDSIPEDAEELALTPEQIRELERRVAEHEADPATAIPWEEVGARLRERYGA